MQITKTGISAFGFSMILMCFYLTSCEEPKVEKPHKKVDYIKRIAGKSDSIPADISQAGEVLIAYADCYTCHKTDKRSMGPAFSDIAQRYPVRDVYITMLGRKVIAGGSGAWGDAIMIPHPGLSIENAKKMVTYILSLNKNRIE